MKGHYVMKDCMKAAEEVDLFNSVLQMNWDYIFFSRLRFLVKSVGTV